MPASTTLTASQQEWQSRYQALKAQQDAYKAQVQNLSSIISPSPTQTNLLKIAKIQQVDVESQLGNLETELHQSITNQIHSVDTTLAGMATTDPAHAQVLAYQSTLVQAQAELDAVAQNWTIPDPGSTIYTIDSIRYSNGTPPQPVGWAYALDSVKNYAVGAVNGAVNVVDSAGVAITNITQWVTTLDPKVQYQLCKSNWENAGTAMGATLPAALGIPTGLVGKIVDAAIGNANDHAFSVGANVCKNIMPKADLLSLVQNDLGTIPADVQYALNSFGSQIEFTVSTDIAGQLAAEMAFSNSVKNSLAINPNMPTDRIFADASQAYGKTMTDFGNAPESTWNFTLTDSANAQSALNSSIDHPTGLQTLTNALSSTGNAVVSNAPSLIDALSLVQAAQSGQPLPVVASGLRVMNDLTSIRVPNNPSDPGGASHLQPTNASLNGATNVASGVLSLMRLDAALKSGDNMDAFTAGAQAISYSASAYVSFADNIANTAATNFAETSLGSTAGSAINGLNTALPYINLVNSIDNNDPTGAAMSVMSMIPATAPIAYAYYAYQLVNSVFSNNAPPEAWGSAHAGWDGYNTVAIAVGDNGGQAMVNNTYTAMLGNLNSIIGTLQQQNPSYQLGLIPNRMPDITLRDYSGFQLTDIDPLSGQQINGGIHYDRAGTLYDAPAGSTLPRNFGEYFIRNALARGAIAPQWEVQTAALQNQAGDPMAGLTETERAGRAGQLAPAAASGATSQTFRPVVLDLNGDGIHTTGSSQTVAFDVDNSGYLKNSAWLSSAADGFLFLDRNFNGQIDAGNELFSNSIVSLTARGLGGMGWVDANYDGKLNSADPVWGRAANDEVFELRRAE